MIINKCYPYREMERITRADGVRHYVDPDNGEMLASVTTILSATADHTELMEWRERVGEKKADATRDEACALGNLMHTHLENHVLGIPRPGGSNVIRKMSERMSSEVINRGLCYVDEVWGTEVALHVPSLYAGTTDLVGLYKGVPAIMDYKTSKKMKTRSNKIMQDYARQAGAYAISHNNTYGTNIQMAVIFMVDRDLNFETFIFEGEEFKRHQASFLDRVEHYQRDFQ